MFRRFLEWLRANFRASFFLDKKALLAQTESIKTAWTKYQKQENERAARIQKHISVLQKDQKDADLNSAFASSMVDNLAGAITNTAN